MKIKKIISLLILASLPLKGFTLSHHFQEQIANLVKKNPSQLTVEEYTTIAEKVEASAPCNLLVFGLGNDSQLWINLNRGGKTVFLENNGEWFKKINDTIPNLNAYLVKYDTTLNQWKDLLDQPGKLRMKLPSEILKTKWNIIFVDAPAGYGNNAGRMQSIYMASWFANQNKKTDVFVHDCDRAAEQAYTKQYLKTENLIKSIDRLRHYYIN